MENILFKIAYPAEFHGQTAVECAIKLHPAVKGRLHDIDKINISTHESALRIIDKTGPLNNPADRDHCLQYMVAIGLLHGNLHADHYEAEAAADPLIDQLRCKMTVVEDRRYSREYMEEDKRSIANSIQVLFTDGTATEKAEVEYPIGHRRRRGEAVPLLEQKFEWNLKSRFPFLQADKIIRLCNDQERLERMAVHQFVDLFII